MKRGMSYIIYIYIAYISLGKDHESFPEPPVSGFIAQDDSRHARSIPPGYGGQLDVWRDRQSLCNGETQPVDREGNHGDSRHERKVSGVEEQHEPHRQERARDHAVGHQVRCLLWQRCVYIGEQSAYERRGNYVVSKLRLSL